MNSKTRTVLANHNRCRVGGDHRRMVDIVVALLMDMAQDLICELRGRHHMRERHFALVDVLLTGPRSRCLHPRHRGGQGARRCEVHRLPSHRRTWVDDFVLVAITVGDLEIMGNEFGADVQRDGLRLA